MDDIYKMLSMYAQSGMHKLLMNYCGLNIEPFSSDVCGGHWHPQSLAEIYRNVGICCSFRAVAAREKYTGFIFFPGNIFKWIFLNENI